MQAILGQGALATQSPRKRAVSPDPIHPVTLGLGRRRGSCGFALPAAFSAAPPVAVSAAHSGFPADHLAAGHPVVGSAVARLDSPTAYFFQSPGP